MMKSKSSINTVSIVSYIIVFMLLSLSSFANAQSLEEALRAAQEGDLATLQRLLDRGNSPDTTDAAGNSLLMVASRQGHRDVVAFLLSRKASVAHASKVGDTALKMASLKGKLEVARLLVENGAEINPAGWTPLHYAAFEGHPEVVKFLLEKGANKNAVAPNEFTALMLAVRGDHTEVARVLLFADPEVNFRSVAGDSALKIANQRGYGPLAELLRRAGAVE